MLGFHFPTDSKGGIFVGLIVGALVGFVFNRIFLKKFRL
jgi:membrane-associated phospholipid phosphatase